MGKERGTNIIFRSILLPVSLSIVGYIAQCFPLKATLGYDCIVSASRSGDQAQRAMGSSFKITYRGLALHISCASSVKIRLREGFGVLSIGMLSHL